MKPNYFLTIDDFKIIEGQGFWFRNDVPPNIWEQVGKHFNNETTIAVYASGSVLSPRKSFGIEAAVGGLDWLKVEIKPKKGESPYNSYHYVIAQIEGHKYPVYGPFKDGCIVPHHFNDDDLNNFLNK